MIGGACLPKTQRTKAKTHLTVWLRIMSVFFGSAVDERNLILCLENDLHLHLSNIDKNSTETRRHDVITTAWFSHATEKEDMIIEESLEVKLPTIWTDGKAEVGRVREEEKKREDQRKERVRRKKMQMCERVAKLCFSNDLWFRRVEK